MSHNLHMSLMKEKRLEDYKVSQLFPVDIFQSEKMKTLGVALCFFKIGRYFSLEDIGQFKVLQKQHEKDLCSCMLYGNEYKNLKSEEQSEVKKLLNKRASSPTRESPYVKFFIKSVLKTLLSNVKFSSHEEEITESWCFAYNNKKYDITLNKDKFLTENMIFVESFKVIDRQGMIKKDAVLNVANLLPIEFNQESLHRLNTIINDQRDKLVFLYSYKEEEQVISVNIQEKKAIKDSKK